MSANLSQPSRTLILQNLLSPAVIIRNLIFIFIHLFVNYLFFSSVYEAVATKGRQTLLRYRANKIADYEALHHTHLWKNGPDPRYVYYIGQSKNFEEWNLNIKKDLSRIRLKPLILFKVFFSFYTLPFLYLHFFY